MAKWGVEALYWNSPVHGKVLLGLETDLSSRVIEIDGFGLFPFKYVMRQQSMGDAVVYTGMVLQERILNVGIYRVLDDRQGLWDDHIGLMTYFNPADGQGHLEQVFPDSTYKVIHGRPAGGLNFRSADQPTPWRQIDVMQVVCEDPFFYAGEPECYSGNFNGTTAVYIAIPNYGQWETWPVFTVTGAVDSPVITLEETGQKIDWAYDNTSGQFVIKCGPGDPEITKTGETNPLQYLSKDSEFFPIPKGHYRLKLTATSGTALLQATIRLRYNAI